MSRAVVLGAVVLGSAVVSHLAGGGLLPHPAVLAILAVGCVGPAVLLLRGPVSTLRLVSVVVLGQTLLHGVLSLLAGHRSGHAHTAAGTAGTAAEAAPVVPPTSAIPTGTLSPDGRRVGSLLDHVGTAGVAGPSADAATPSAGWLSSVLGHLVTDLAQQGPAMVLAHAAGAVALGLWLAVGESALWHLVALGLTRAHTPWVAARLAQGSLTGLRGTSSCAARIRVPHRPIRPWHDQLARPALSRRGPPVLAVA